MKWNPGETHKDTLATTSDVELLESEDSEAQLSKLVIRAERERKEKQSGRT